MFEKQNAYCPPYMDEPKPQISHNMEWCKAFCFSHCCKHSAISCSSSWLPHFRRVSTWDILNIIWLGLASFQGSELDKVH